jgi:hypothetical protein
MLDHRFRQQINGFLQDVLDSIGKVKKASCVITLATVVEFSDQNNLET